MRPEVCYNFLLCVSCSLSETKQTIDSLLVLGTIKVPSLMGRTGVALDLSDEGECLSPPEEKLLQAPLWQEPQFAAARQLLCSPLRPPQVVSAAGQMPQVEGSVPGRTLALTASRVWTEDVRVRAPAVVVIATAGIIIML